MSKAILLLEAVGSVEPGVPPTPTYLTINSNTHINIDAHSIESGSMGPPAIQLLPPLTALVSATSCTITNTSIAGQTWADMVTTMSDVQATYVAGKTNINICKESRNHFANGFSYAQMLTNVLNYTTSLFAGHSDWISVYMEAAPSDGVPTATWNAEMFAADTYVRNHLDEFGISKFIRLRDLSTFSGDGLSRQGFMTSTTTCLESTAPYVHPTGFPREQEAGRIARDLQLIPVP